MIIGRNYQKAYDQVLDRVKPTKEEAKEDWNFIGKLVEKLDRITPRDIHVEVAGSIAKGTSRKGDRDFDVFLLFSKNYTVMELMKDGLKYAKQAVKGHKYEIAYAEHPYLRAWIEGNEVDIVPSYRISDISEKLTSVDRSPLHTRYINSVLDEKQKDEVRLLKQFLRGAGIYGAEGKIQGFSGYLCELLIVAHGDFTNLLDAASKWKGVSVFDLEKKRPDGELKNKFPGAAMIVIDPVDENRNAAAAVSKTSLSVFIHSARGFLTSPSVRYFFPPEQKVNKKWVEKQLAQRDSYIVGIEIEKPRIVEDILWPQLYKFADRIVHRAEDHNFSAFDTDIAEKNGRILVLFEFEIYQLPEMRKVIGPPLWFRKDVEDFIKKHKVIEPIWFGHDRILSLAKRRFKRIDELLKDIKAKPKAYGVPPDIHKKMPKSRILGLPEIKKRYPEFLYNYLQKRNL
jgi:tRNA nucleotidyltransferase (CCA-adding enzyme)